MAPAPGTTHKSEDWVSAVDRLIAMMKAKEFEQQEEPPKAEGSFPEPF